MLSYPVHRSFTDASVLHAAKLLTRNIFAPLQRAALALLYAAHAGVAASERSASSVPAQHNLYTAWRMNTESAQLLFENTPEKTQILGGNCLS